MARIDSDSLVQHATMLGLVTPNQAEECAENPEHSKSNPASLLKVMERKGYLTPWQSQKLLKGDRDGYFLGGFRLLYKISSGSFGRVFRADDPHTGKIVAVKVLRNRWSDNPHSVELFEREGKVGLSLKHPNIVQILAVDFDPLSKQHFIVMEFVEGGSLKDFISIRKKLTAPEALRLIDDAAAGLNYAYGKGLTHRDIKPTNMLISSNGSVKLVDFGLAGVNSTMGGRPEEDAKVERTVDYAGLEKATGVKANDTRSDIYFLGCVLYEMLTGRSPLEATKDKNARMAKQRFDSVVSIKPGEVQGPPSLFRLVETMMALDPGRRYQNPAKLLEAIKGARLEADGKAPAPGDTAAAPPPTVARSVFVVEQNEKLQDAIRNKFKEVGFRVLMSTDPERAFLRYQEAPYDALIIDAGTTGEEGLRALRRIVENADRRSRAVAAVLLLNENQANWTERVEPNPKLATLVRPVTLRQLYTAVQELIDAQA